MLTLRENAKFRANLYGADRHWIAENIDRVIEFAALTDQAERPLFNVDPLHIKRLGLAIALHIDADVFVFDESLALRDPAIRDKGLQRVTQLLEGRAALIFSQDRDLLWSISQRGIVLNEGQMFFDGELGQAIAAFDELREQERARGNRELLATTVSDLLDGDEGEEGEDGFEEDQLDDREIADEDRLSRDREPR